jgi:hypothetical protein
MLAAGIPLLVLYLFVVWAALGVPSSTLKSKIKR